MKNLIRFSDFDLVNCVAVFGADVAAFVLGLYSQEYLGTVNVTGRPHTKRLPLTD